MSIEVRGHSRFDRAAELRFRALAWIVDFFAALLLIEILYLTTGMDPVLDIKLGLLFAVLFLGIAVPFRKYLGGSLGERIWRISKGRTRYRDTAHVWLGSFLTALLITASIGSFEWNIATHPYWSTSEALKLQASVPPADWHVLAFYYTLAPWPTTVDGHPVFYSVPYEVGPPQRFIGHIESDWIHESVRLRLEGPKTPMDYQSRALTREQLKECFLDSPLLNPRCVDIRRTTLEKSLQELHDEGYTKFETSWFYVDNSTIPDETRTQGIRLRGRTSDLVKSRVQDRYILITPHGIHQSITLSYFDDEEGLQAEKDFRTALGALQISEEINPGRAWVDHLLESTKLSALESAADSPHYLEGLAEIQSVLVSKLSVEPSSFDAYYHLAGSSFLLLKYSTKHPDPDLKNLAQATVDRMNRYAHDVSQKATAPDPKLPMLEHMAQDARQF
jgi:hypothetical protein